MSNTMTQNTPLTTTGYLESSNRRYLAYVTRDGNFIVKSGKVNGPFFRTIWRGNASANPDADYVMNLQADGRLVVSYGDNISWFSDAEGPHANDPGGGNRQYYGVMQDDGIFALYEGVPPDANAPSPTGADNAYWHTGGATPLARVQSGSTSAAARGVVLTMLGVIPEVGGLLSSLVGLAWSEDDLWSQIKEQVEQLIDQKLDDYVWQTAQGRITSAKTYLDQYSDAARIFAQTQQNGADVIESYGRAVDFFISNMPQVMVKGYEVLLMPAMALMATMEIYLRRDAVQFGAAWKMDAHAVNAAATELTQAIDQYSTYIDDHVYDSYPSYNGVKNSAISADLVAMRAQNQYTAFMQLNVLDYRELWAFAAPSCSWPVTTPAKLTRTIRSGPYNSAVSQSIPVTRSGDQSKPLQRITVTYSIRLLAADLVYGDLGTPTDSPSPAGPDGGEMLGGMFYGIYKQTILADDPITVFSQPLNLYPVNVGRDVHEGENGWCPAFVTAGGRAFYCFEQVADANYPFYYEGALMLTDSFPGHALHDVDTTNAPNFELVWRRADSFSSPALAPSARPPNAPRRRIAEAEDRREPTGTQSGRQLPTPATAAPTRLAKWRRVLTCIRQRLSALLGVALRWLWPRKP